MAATLTSLPEDLLLMVLSRLDGRSLARLEYVPWHSLLYPFCPLLLLLSPIDIA